MSSIESEVSKNNILGFWYSDENGNIATVVDIKDNVCSVKYASGEIKKESLDYVQSIFMDSEETKECDDEADWYGGMDDDLGWEYD